MGSIRGKNRRSKISCYCPFKAESIFVSWFDSLTVNFLSCTKSENLASGCGEGGGRKRGGYCLYNYTCEVYCNYGYIHVQYIVSKKQIALSDSFFIWCGRMQNAVLCNRFGLCCAYILWIFKTDVCTLHVVSVHRGFTVQNIYTKKYGLALV
jgi:hypothetical protein